MFYRPTYRLLTDLQTPRLDLALGAVTDGLQRLAPLFEPVYEALAAHSRRQPFWHGDATRWLVCATVEGKEGFRGYLWVVDSAAVVVLVLAHGRAHDVPEEHPGPEAAGIRVVDRYKAYQAMDQVKRGRIVLAFCWAPVRRDFLTVARTGPDHAAWALNGVGRIGAVYRLNDARRAVREEAAAFALADARRRAAVTALGAQGEAELAEPALHPARRKALESLGNHGTGLTGFVEHPQVPMDNNTAARAQRGPGGAEELLRQRRGVGGPVGGHAVLVGADVVLVEPESAGVVDGVPDRVRGGGGRGAWSGGTLLAMEPE